MVYIIIIGTEHNLGEKYVVQRPYLVLDGVGLHEEGKILGLGLDDPVHALVVALHRQQQIKHVGQLWGRF